MYWTNYRKYQEKQFLICFSEEKLKNVVQVAVGLAKLYPKKSEFLYWLPNSAI